MFKIGEFARLSQLSIKTLRYYDGLGLLKPSHTDRFTGYRYYSANQLSRLSRILVLKELGFSLEQVAELLDEELSVEEMRGMLRLRRAEQAARVQQEQARLAQIEARLRLLQGQNAPAYEVVTKSVESQWVAAQRATLARPPDIAGVLDEVWAYVGAHGVEAQYDATIWHDGTPDGGDWDGEGVVFLPGLLPASERIRVYELAGWPLVASVIHNGSYLTLPTAYSALAAWLEASPYEIVGPNRELYLLGGADQNDPTYVTELQFPIELRPSPSSRSTP